MTRFVWLRLLRHLGTGNPSRRASPSKRCVSRHRGVRPRLETLEDRLTPNTYMATPTAADGATDSLRAAITQANSDSGTDTDTIQLQAGTYKLTVDNTANEHEQANASGDLNITNTNHALVIQGAAPDANGKPTTVIQQTVEDRVFQIVKAGTTVTFKDVIIEGGYDQDDGKEGTVARSSDAKGGGILDQGGNVTLSNVVLQSNKAVAGSSPATGFAAYGGGIYVEKGSLTINSSVIQLNSAIGSDVSSSIDGGAAEGGGIYVSGTTTITDSILSNNTLYGGSYPGVIISSGNGGAAAGGGIYALGSAAISDSILSGNTVTGGRSRDGSGGLASGGGVYTSGKATITDSTLTGNTLYGGDSDSGHGGWAVGGAAWDDGKITIADSDLSGNALHGGYGGYAGGWVLGGGVFNNSGTTTITHATLSGNNLIGGTCDISTPANLSYNAGGNAQGGGVFSSESSTTVISSSTLSGNTLIGGMGSLDNSSAVIDGDLGGSAQGGGVYVQSSSTATINTSILSGNKLTGGEGDYGSGTLKGDITGSAQGGGIYVYPDHTATASIFASTLSDNTLTGGHGIGAGIVGPGSAQGGGAYFGGAGIQLVNSTIVDNQATGTSEGGGLYFASSATATLTNDTVVGNQASLDISLGDSTGGGIENTNTAAQAVTLTNTLVAINNAIIGPDYNGTVSSNSGHNLIGIADGSSGFNTGDNLLGSTAKPINPLLDPLQINGGPTPTLALLPGSPAIDAGDNSAQSVTGPDDQRSDGFARVSKGAIDIGAFEVQQPPPTLPPPPPPSSGGSGPSSSPAPPPTLHTPPLLAFFDTMLAGVEMVNGNRTETVVDSIFGFPLLISTYDGAGDLMSVTLFGMNVTLLFESL